MNNLQKNNTNNDGAYTRKKAIEILVKILENNKPLDNAFEESTKKSSHFSKLINCKYLSFIASSFLFKKNRSPHRKKNQYGCKKKKRKNNKH